VRLVKSAKMSCFTAICFCGFLPSSARHFAGFLDESVFSDVFYGKSKLRPALFKGQCRHRSCVPDLGTSGSGRLQPSWILGLDSNEIVWTCRPGY
jgi:hypothetical protein